MASQDIITRHLCLAADVERYSRLDIPQQERTQAELVGVLDRAAALSSLDRLSWNRQPQGDQEFAVLPVGTPEQVVLGEFVRNLTVALKECNAHRPRKQPMRLRLAVDIGVARTAALGHSGPAPIAVARYLNAPPLKSVLSGTRTTDLAVIVSDRLYQDVVQHHSHGLDPDQYVKVHVQHDEFAAYGWIQIPEHSKAEIHGLALNGRPVAGMADGKREDPSMNTPEAIAALAGSAVVGAMATDAWSFVRDRCAALLDRHAPEERPTVLDLFEGFDRCLSTVEGEQHDSLAAMFADRAATALAPIAALSGEAADEVRALAEAADSARTDSAPRNAISVRDVRAKGDFILGGRDTNVYKGGQR
ncbi:hypothetical protein [Streptomyces sp. S465]|uniref:hypothetical protein n=1 Tax=Streptomyces sp. S465 TaxID=2979468 RepID=UPI0022A84A2E|nr:hypothetical protein [Streptomyces sp. S465]WAP55060.1 hypothetical protein N6H00_08745 [Streptomyces sp. S465]